MILTFTILIITITLFIIDKLRVDIVAMLALLALVLTGLINTDQALAGFANSTVVTIAGLFVVGEGLFRTGVADWMGEKLLKLAGSSQNRLLVVLMLGTALLSGFLSNTGTVAVLLPVVVATAWRIRSLPSKLLIPLAFGASIGGMLTLIGTPPNIVITNTLREMDLRPFGFFEYGLLGLPLLLVGIGYMLLVGQRWLPARRIGEREPAQFFSAAELAEAYHLEGALFRLRARRGSSLVGQTLAQAGLGRDYGVTVVRIERAAEEESRLHRPAQQALDSFSDTFGMRQPDPDSQIPGPNTAIYADDVLVVEGTEEAVNRMALRFNLGIQPIRPDDDDRPPVEWLSREIGLAEVLLTPRSALIGQTLVEADFGEKYNVRVLGISRRGQPVEEVPVTSLKLTFGDALVVRGTWQAIEIMQRESRNFVVVGRPAAMAQPTGLTPRALIALAAMLAMLLMMVTGLVPTVIAVLITALIMVLGGCVNMTEAYRAVNWESVILIAAMLPMSTALEISGGATFIANGLVNTLGVLHPLLLLVGVFVMTTGFTQVISNTATTVLVAPIAIQAAANLGIASHPVMMMVAVGASSAFLTPIASPVNTLILTPGGYNFGDFMKAGLPLLIIFLLISLLVVPLIWPL
jgi:di/tricarboxylate transporter